MTDIPGLIERARVDARTFVRDWDATIALLNEAAAALTELQARLTSSQLQCRDAVERYETAQETIAKLRKALEGIEWEVEGEAINENGKPNTAMRVLKDCRAALAAGEKP